MLVSKVYHRCGRTGFEDQQEAAIEPRFEPSRVVITFARSRNGEATMAASATPSQIHCGSTRTWVFGGKRTLKEERLRTKPRTWKAWRPTQHD